MSNGAQKEVWSTVRQLSETEGTFVTMQRLIVACELMPFCLNTAGDLKSHVEKRHNDAALATFVPFGKIIMFGYHTTLPFTDTS